MVELTSPGSAEPVALAKRYVPELSGSGLQCRLELRDVGLERRAIGLGRECDLQCLTAGGGGVLEPCRGVTKFTLPPLKAVSLGSEEARCNPTRFCFVRGGGAVLP